MTDEQGVVLAEKLFNKAFMFAAVSNGNQCISVSDGISLRFITNDKWLTIQILHAGCGKQPKTQTWVKVKRIIEKSEHIPKKEVVKSDMQVSTEVNTKLAW